MQLEVSQLHMYYVYMLSQNQLKICQERQELFRVSPSFLGQASMSTVLQQADAPVTHFEIFLIESCHHFLEKFQIAVVFLFCYRSGMFRILNYHLECLKFRHLETTWRDFC